MSNLCIIPARGGSKRIPKKNIKDFLGKPIIAYSIAVALQSELFDEVMVSTDDEDIAEIAEKYGAKVPFFRSKENSDDFATTAEVLIEVINKYIETNALFNYVCCIYPTAPFVTSIVLSKGFEKLVNQNLDTVLPVVNYDYSIWRGLKSMENGILEMVWPEYMDSRSQDLREVFHDAGQWYWLKEEALIKNKKIFNKKMAPINMSPIEVQDIDNLDDWKLAELKYKYLTI